jgi:hypothetical protein
MFEGNLSMRSHPNVAAGVGVFPLQCRCVALILTKLPLQKALPQAKIQNWKQTQILWIIPELSCNRCPINIELRMGPTVQAGSSQRL